MTSKSRSSTVRYDLIHSASGLPSNGPQALGSERALPATSASAMNSVANAARSAGNTMTVASFE